MKIEELLNKADDLEKRVLDLKSKEKEERDNKEFAEKREKSFYKGNFKNMENENKEFRTIAQRFVETRADEGLKINGTGMDYYGSLVEKFRIAKPLTSKVAFMRGSYTGFQIPLIKSRPAVQASATEGDTGLAVDSQMAIGKLTITPELFYSILPITYQTEKFSMVSDAEIEDAFAEAFGEKIEYDLQGRNAGANYAISGILSNDTSVCASGNTVTAGTAGAVSWEDMYALVDKVKGKVGNWTIVVPSSVVSKLIATSAKEYSFCKEELLRNGTIRGVEVVEVATPFETETGKVYATIIDLNKNLKVCVAADDVILRTVYDKNSLNKYLQGAMGIAAKVALPSEVFQLIGA